MSRIRLSVVALLAIAAGCTGPEWYVNGGAAPKQEAAPAKKEAAPAPPKKAAPVAGELDFVDPVGDDNGPGTYKYPTDPVYKPGSFDITEFKVKDLGTKVQFSLSVNSDLENPWSMPDPANFSVQMGFVFIQAAPGGHTEGIPGLNVTFAPDSAWNKVVLISPQPAGRVRAEARDKAAALKADIVAPTDTSAKGRTITCTVEKKDLPPGDPTKWAYQLVLQSNEGFPDKKDLLTRKVNEFEGQHRFGGGTDTDCDPHVIDLLAGKAVGDKSEVDEQHQMLAYECNPDGTPKKQAVLKMIRK